MKKTLLSIAASFLCLFAAFPFYAKAQTEADKISLQQLTDGTFSPQHLYGVHPLNDGESYSRLSDDGRRIVRSSFKTGQEVGVLFDLDQARTTAKISRIDGYIMSPDEKRILLQTETRAIYRRTFTAVYYLYDVTSRKMERLSEGGPQMSPLFSPEGIIIPKVLVPYTGFERIS